MVYHAADWAGHYEAGELPWDLGGPHPYLRHALQPQEVRGLRALVPGAGAGHDAAHLAHLGATVSALDLTPQARDWHRRLYGQQVADYRVGDFLQQPPGETWDLLLEHTCFCAIPPARRGDYVLAAHRALVPGGRVFMLAMVGDERDGPPHPMPLDEMKSLFGQHFSLLKEEPLEGNLTARPGMEWFLWWEKKDVNTLSETE